MAVTTTPLGFQKPDGNEPVRNGDNVIAANAQRAEDEIQGARGRLNTIEAKNIVQDNRLNNVEAKNTAQDGTLATHAARLANLDNAAGFTGDPLALNDAAFAETLKNGDATHTALDARLAVQVPPFVNDTISKDPTVAQNAATLAQSAAGLLPVWKANTAYAAGQRVVAPSGDVVSAKVSFTSGAAYSATNWNASTQAGRIDAVEATAATAMQPWKAGAAYAAGARVVAPSGDVVSAKAAFTSGATYSAANWNASTQDGRIGAVESGVTKLSIPALNDWFTALANWQTKPAQVVVIGDSISEGADAGDISNRWQTRAQKYLREAYGVTGGAKFPFIPVLPATSGATAWPVTRTDPGGLIAADSNWGLGWRAAKLFAGAVVSFTFTGTSAAVMFTKASAVGVLRIVVDGGAPTLVDSNSVTNGPTADAATWNTGPLAAGSHTIDVSFDASTPAGITNVLVHGLLTWNGDETSGIRFIDAAHSGYRSANFTTTTARTAANAVKAAGGAQLAVIAIGTNDTLYPADFPNYRANVERMISALRTTAGFAGSILIINWYMTNQMTDAQWAPYGEIMAQIAAADPKVAYLDMRRRMPDMPTPYTGPEGLGYYAGNVHPNARGYKFIADEVSKYITNGR